MQGYTGGVVYLIRRIIFSKNRKQIIRLEERRKLIFPSDWDLSEIKSLSGTGHRGVVEYDGGDLDRTYGPTWFLNNVAKETGLSDDLQKMFGGNVEMAQDGSQCLPSLRRCRPSVASSTMAVGSSSRHLSESNSLYAMLSASRFLKDAVEPTHPRNPTRESAVARLSRKPRIFSTNNCKTQK